MPRERMVLRILRSNAALTLDAARRIEQGWHDAAWAKSLHRQDSCHAPCDHDDRVYRREYNAHVANHFA